MNTLEFLQTGLLQQDFLKPCIERVHSCVTNTASTLTVFHNKFDSLALEYLGHPLEIIASKIAEVAVQIFSVLAGALLFLSNSSLFVIGFAAGAVSPEWWSEKLDRVNMAWERQAFGIRALVVTAGVFAWPISLAVSALFVGASLGIAFTKQEQQALHP